MNITNLNKYHHQVRKEVEVEEVEEVEIEGEEFENEKKEEKHHSNE